MAEIFNALEVMELAVQIARNGERFYHTVARSTPHDAVRCLFDYLAADERMHQEVFTEAIRRLESETHLERPSLSLDMEYSQYLTALANSLVFQNPEEAARKAATLKKTRDIFELAYAREKEEILIHRELKKITPKELGQEALDRLIEEDEKHIRELHNLEQALLKDHLKKEP